MINYQTKKLGEVCEVSSGNSAPQKDDYFQDGGFPFFRTSDVGSVHVSQNLCDTRDYLNEKGIKGMTLYKQGTILFPKSGASTFLNHRVMMGCDGYVSSHLATIKANNNLVDEKYLFHFLLTVDAKEIGANSAYPSLKVSDISNIEISLPPLLDQKKVVKLLDEKMGKINEAKRLREEALVDTEKILSQTLHEIFSEARKEFFVINLEEVATLVRGPFGGSLKKEIFIPKGDCVYEQGNVINNDLENFRYFITSEKFKEMTRFSVSVGDILMSCSGTIGKLIIIPEKFRKGIINQALLKISPNKKIQGEYLKYALKDYLFGNTDHIKGMAIKNIAAVKELKKIKLPLPPLLEQQKIVKRLDALSAKIRQAVELQKSQLEDLEKLEKAYLREAFNGELV